jgi:glycosyltransferase involved in cell wall biosynthesis
MRVLHLLSNKKWTERAEPATDLVRAQCELGVEAQLACGRWDRPDRLDNSVEVQARRKGVEPVLLELTKHFRLSPARRDLRQLQDRIDREEIDVLHAHMENAHLLAVLAARRSRRRPCVVSSHYDPSPPRAGLRARGLYRFGTDGVVVIDDETARAFSSRFGFPASRVAVIEPGIDLALFDPTRNLTGGRAEFGLAPEDIVLGMVTRIRADRRVDLAMGALSELRDAFPGLRLLIIGRGEGEQDMRALADSLGLDDRVVWGGYRRADELVAAYRAMDLLLYPAPGTDKSCRTIREAMAAGLPVAGARTGFVQKLIDPDRTGLLFEPGADELPGLLRRLCANCADLAAMGQAARETAMTRFSLEQQARRTLEFYSSLLSR